MKNFFTFSLLLFCSIVFAQKIGKAEINLYGKLNEKSIGLYDVWLEKDGAFLMMFEKTTVGVKHAMDKAEKILKVNSLSFDNPDEDESLLDRMVHGAKDYDNIDFTVQLSKSEVKKIWNIDGGIFALLLNKDLYMVVYSKKPTNYSKY